MSEADKFRELLDSLPQERPDNKECAKILDARAPPCGCEQATSPAGSFGPVTSNEQLIRFVVIPFGVRVKIFEKKGLEGLKPSCLGDVATCGLSVVRYVHATDHEMAISIANLCNGARAQEPIKGGAIGYFEMPVALLRSHDPDKANQRFCVYETPLDMAEGDKARPAHADVFASSLNSSLTEDEFDLFKIDARNELFNRVRESYHVGVGDLSGGILLEYQSPLIDG